MRLRGALALVVELAARALEAFVERTGDFGWNRPEAHPLRLGVADFLFKGPPPRPFVLRASRGAARDRVGRQPLAPLLREHLGWGQTCLTCRLRRDQFLDSREQFFHPLSRRLGIEVGAGKGGGPRRHQTADRLEVARGHVLLDSARKFRRLLPAGARLLHGGMEIFRRGTDLGSGYRNERFELANHDVAYRGLLLELHLIAMLVTIEEAV